MKIISILFLTISLFIFSCKYEKGPQPIVKKVDACDLVVSYSVSILPIVTTKCAANSGCHESGSIDGDYTSYFDLKTTAKNGKLNNRVLVLKDMPIPGNPALTDTELSKLNCWIKQGYPNN